MLCISMCIIMFILDEFLLIFCSVLMSSNVIFFFFECLEAPWTHLRWGGGGGGGGIQSEIECVCVCMVVCVCYQERVWCVGDLE